MVDVRFASEVAGVQNVMRDLGDGSHAEVAAIAYPAGLLDAFGRLRVRSERSRCWRRATPEPRRVA